MALYHDATITPTKAELLEQWVPTQPWGCAGAPIEVIGAYRFDDPEGRVGMETHLVMSGDTLVQVPLTYREQPRDVAAGDSDKGLVGQMEHSALGTRWVYDGLTDDRYLVMLAAFALTGQGEALGMVVYDGAWFVAPTHVRLRGGGWTQERVSVDGFAPTSVGADTGGPVGFTNEGFLLTFHRHPPAGNQPPMGITATWNGHPDPVVLAEISQR